MPDELLQLHPGEFLRYLRWRLDLGVTLTRDQRIDFERALRVFGSDPVLIRRAEGQLLTLESPGERGRA